MKQETERGLTIAIVDADFEKPVKEHAIIHAQQSGETIEISNNSFPPPTKYIFKTLPQTTEIKTGQQRRRERRKQQRKNKWQ